MTDEHQTADEPQADTTPQPESALVSAVVDLAALAGVGSFTYGVWLVFHPAAFMVAGAFLLTGAWLATRKGIVG
jgi:hypothetical protein